MILVDTSVWIEYLNGRDGPEVEYLDKVISSDRIIVGDLVLAELLSGLRSDVDAEAVQSRLLRCEFRELGGYDVAVTAARYYRLLRSHGVTVRKLIDMIIGTWCIVNNAKLLHRDRDFNALEARCGLRVAR
jgi:predicted nucleic acid-binding protein